SPGSRAALAALCGAYWYPLYAYVRRQGGDADEAYDLTQGYFAALLEGELLRDVRPEAGRFRSFLLVSLRHFLSKQRARERAVKRGGRVAVVSLDAARAAARYDAEPVTALDPEAVYERRWALTVLERVLERLRRDEEGSGHGEQFAHLSPYLTGIEPRVPYRDTAHTLGTSEGAIKVAVHRLRRRYGELLRAEIAETVADPELVDAELRHLLGAVGSWEPARA
ncbi:MAG TPA: sigma-70 family RNA polymerase sigma factor, partial [Thermoanaerobaculia bacterium]|nr:sigma-70 family RNA polymerase sigma factor [Thermoanaerobaculia bacterium]